VKTLFEATAAANGPGAASSFQFSTTGKDAPFDAWRSLLAVLFDCTPAKESLPAAFDAELVVRHFGTFLLFRSFADGGRYRRSPARLAWDDLDHIAISCLLSGGVALGGPVRRLRPGDVSVVDLSSPVNFSLKAAEAMHLILPRTALPAAVVSVTPLPCRVFARDTAMGIFIRGLLEALSQASRYFNAVEVMALAPSFPELLGWCLGTAALPPTTAAKGDLGKRLRRFIEDNLNRPDLTSARLAREVGVSRSQLYRQFEASGGVETYIRRRRLRRSLQALSDPRRAHLRIGEIAYDMGFADEAHFSRLFRQTFGQSPRDMRTATQAANHQNLHSLPFPSGDGASFADWLLTLGTG
jgi:AraC-like DNA-binding protein